MGEIADMMIDGTLCEGCGEYIGEGDGFPQYCSSDCAGDRGANVEQIKPSKNSAGKRRRAKRRRERKAQERRDILKVADATGWTQHTEYHWSKTLCGLRFQFWPSGKKAMFNGQVYKGVEDIAELEKSLSESIKGKK